MNFIIKILLRENEETTIFPNKFCINSRIFTDLIITFKLIIFFMYPILINQINAHYTQIHINYSTAV
jgi:hypothetical protein